jgi:plastocyanin
MRAVRVAFLCGMVLPWTPHLFAATVSGTVRTMPRPGIAPATAIVYAEKLDGNVPPRPGTFSLTQRNKAFVPSMLAVPAGSAVDFPNEDLIFHNVFSLSAPAPFDLGLYRAGASKRRVFSEPGTYRVFCNIHPHMTAFIAVVPTPFVTQTDAAGAFQLDLPPGRYRLTALSERSTPVTTEVEVAAAPTAAPALTLDESAWAPAPHLNKFGKAYAPGAYEKLK